MSSPAGVRGIIEYQGKFLVVRNKAAQSDFWCLPGGNVEEGEEIQAALIREMVEETGIKPAIGNLLFIHQMKNRKDNQWGHPDFIFHIINAADYLKIDLSKTTHGESELHDIGFQDIKDLYLLPDFLITELPKLKGQCYAAPVQIKHDIFDF